MYLHNVTKYKKFSLNIDFLCCTGVNHHNLDQEVFFARLQVSITQQFLFSFLNDSLNFTILPNLLNGIKTNCMIFYKNLFNVLNYTEILS